MHFVRMWTRPWKYKEGVVTGAGLILTGACLQLTLGRVEWDFFAAPVNYMALALFVAIVVTAHIFRHRLYVLTWLSSTSSAVTSIGWASALTVVMGLVRQVPSSEPSSSFPWLDQMLSNWSFVLVYVWMTVSLALTILRVCIPFRASRIPFLLNHLGLLTALICGVLGSADLRRLKMTAPMGSPEWRAVDDNGKVHELPLAVELKSFDIDEYPPKLMLVDNVTGQGLPADAPQNILLEDGVRGGTLCGNAVEILQILPDAAPVFGADTVIYEEFHSSGSCAAALVRLTGEGGSPVEGWVSCGSYAFPVKALSVDSNVSVVMPPREPRRYVSSVNIYTQSGGSYADTIQVNHPCRIEGWKIYQYNYDRVMGRWSEYSVFEIIHDPWLPAVYAGILMLIAGAVCMFVQFGAGKKEEEI